MSLFPLFPARATASAPVGRNPDDDHWWGGIYRQTAAGVNVTIERARQVPVVKASLNNLASTTAGLAFNIFERRSGDNRATRSDHPVAQLLNDPNPYQTSFEFFKTLVDDLAAGGEFFGELKFDGLTAAITEVWPLERALCDIEVIADGSRRLRVTERRGVTRYLIEGEFWHIALPPYREGFRGRSPILHDGREAIAAAIALQDYANAFFKNDALPPFFFRMDGEFEDEDSKGNFLSAWRRWFSGRNRHKPGILEHGIDVVKLAHSNEEAQFLETRKEVWTDCARLWNMPPHKVGILDKATFSNIENQSLEYVTETLGPWLELIERSIGKWLIDDPRFYFEFNVASLLRGDIKTRFGAYAVARQWGWLSVNEIRRRENMNGIGPSGDRYMEPLNMAPAGSVSEGRTTDEQQSEQATIAFLRRSVARNGGRPQLRVIDNAA